jgi:hypothetical protein
MSGFDDAGIPVLTQVVTPVERNTSKPVDAEPLPEPPVTIIPNAASAVAQERRAGEEAKDARRRLEQELTGRILQQKLGRIDGLLDQRIRDELADVVQVAADSLVAEIRSSLQQTLEQVITQAVAQEMAKLRSDKTKNH